MNIMTIRGVKLMALAMLCGCTVGPPYLKPSVQSPSAYKELTAAQFKDTDGWKVAAPQDTTLRDKWWELFGDPQLSALEEQVKVSNQNVAAAYAAFMQARAMVKQAQAQYWPTLTVGASMTRSHQPAGVGAAAASGTGTSAASSSGGTGTSATSTSGTGITSVSSEGGTGNFFSLPFDASWTPDLWGKVRNLVKGNIAAAQASAADLANAQLTAQAEVAVDYFELRSQDDLIALADATVKAYTESLALTQAQYETGIASDETVAQAQVQLQTTQAQATNLGIQRAQYEHAIAVLVGQPASTFSVAARSSNVQPPAVPFGVPSQLLERRPDVAADERLMAQANAQIGVEDAAYFPTLTLSASAGFDSTTAADWLTWPARFWSVGPSLSETIFDGGLRSANVAQYRAAYNEAVANYRQTVLTAFQQVEDNLASLRILSQELAQQDQAVASSQHYVTLATDRYRLGLDPYLDVVTAQTSLFSNQQTNVNLRMQQLTATVQLIEALGGGWDSSQLPTSGDISAGKAQH
jgi:NodT family efflux transporter outer membrane factor (OMF) lipoprotein